MRSRANISIVLKTTASLLVWCLLPSTVLADFYDVLLEQRHERRTYIVFHRLEVDKQHGFDQHYLEVHGYHEDKPGQRIRLGRKERNALRDLGHYDLYMQAVRKQQEKELDNLRKKGFRPATVIQPDKGSSPLEVRWSIDGKTVGLVVEEKKKSTRLVLKRGKRSVLLHKFDKDWRRKGNDSLKRTVRSIRQVAFAGNGRVLVVILREVPVPTNPEFVRDVVLRFHTRKPLEKLGLDYPMKDATPLPKKTP